MAELGNMLFDQAGGGIRLSRDLNEEIFAELKRLFDAAGPDRDMSWRDYGPEFENGTFQIWPYSWEDCDCGYDKKEWDWHEANKHGPLCYQSELEAEMSKYDAESGYLQIKEKAFGGNDHPLFGRMNTEQEPLEIDGVEVGFSMVMTPRDDPEMEAYDEANDKRRRHEEKCRASLCIKYGLSFPEGSAVHCTCDYTDRWSAWSRLNDHDPRCAVARKSFLFKPTGFWLDWYKYPLRDAHTSKTLRKGEFGEIVTACIASLPKDPGGKIVRLRDAN